MTMSFQLETWVVSPYKKPERDIPENEEFNNHLSMVRIRSEHAIGFLKGRFHSLKHLRLRISDEHSHKFATYWIAACIGIHAFAMQCESEEQEDTDSDFQDPFIAEGLSSSSDSEVTPQPPRRNISQYRLHAAKAKREKLKRALFRAKEKRRHDREAEDEDLEGSS
jgi:DDE superfamily endonuclease